MNSHGNENGAITLIERYDKPAAVELASFDGERNLSINCAELRYLRRYLILVGQWYPKDLEFNEESFLSYLAGRKH
jgi:hypothetical protein